MTSLFDNPKFGGRKPDQVKKDLAVIAYNWEKVIDAIEYPTRVHAIRMLRYLVDSYMQGLGINSFDYPIAADNVIFHSEFAYAILDTCIKAEKGEHLFPALAKTGVISDSFAFLQALRADIELSEYNFKKRGDKL